MVLTCSWYLLLQVKQYYFIRVYFLIADAMQQCSFIIIGTKPLSHMSVAKKNKYFVISLTVSFCTKIIHTVEAEKFIVVHVFGLLSSLIIFYCFHLVAKLIAFLTFIGLSVPLTITFTHLGVIMSTNNTSL